MSTNCTVAIQNEDGSVTGIYNHWDGYLSGVGAELLKTYNTERSVKELIMLGDCSTIVNNVEAYHRDRDEDWKNVAPRVHDDYSAFIDVMGQEYNYLFDKGVWMVSEAYADTDAMQPLQEALSKEQLED
jgi:hypothetical protein